MLELVLMLVGIAATVWWMFWRVDQGPFMTVCGGLSLALVYWLIGMPFPVAFGVALCFTAGVWMWPRARA